MRSINKIKNWHNKIKTSKDIKNWLSVSWDDEYIFINVSHPLDCSGEFNWAEKLEWFRIVKVCYEINNFPINDYIIIYTEDPKDKYTIPLNAENAQCFFDLLVIKGLIGSDLESKTNGVVEGLFCWP